MGLHHLSSVFWSVSDVFSFCTLPNHLLATLYSHFRSDSFCATAKSSLLSAAAFILPSTPETTQPWNSQAPKNLPTCQWSNWGCLSPCKGKSDMKKKTKKKHRARLLRVHNCCEATMELVVIFGHFAWPIWCWRKKGLMSRRGDGPYMPLVWSGACLS